MPLLLIFLAGTAIGAGGTLFATDAIDKLVKAGLLAGAGFIAFKVLSK